jgi:DNA-binding response OmpR family regulator
MNFNQTADAEAPAKARTPVIPPAPRRILVVEDDGDMRRLNTEVLRRSGYQVDAAADGAAAWDAIRANRYQLLITDNHMPKLTGLELLRKLRDGRVVLPVIMATGTVPEQEFAASPWLIPDATLLKPYTVPELLATVRAVLSANESDRVTLPVAPETNGSNPPSANGSWQAFKLSNLDWKEVEKTIAHRGNPPS